MNCFFNWQMKVYATIHQPLGCYKIHFFSLFCLLKLSSFVFKCTITTNVAKTAAAASSMREPVLVNTEHEVTHCDAHDMHEKSGDVA